MATDSTRPDASTSQPEPAQPPVEPAPDTTWVTFEDISKSVSPDDDIEIK